MSENSDGRVTSVATFDDASVQTVAALPGVTAANGIAFLPDEVLQDGRNSVTANVMGVGAGPLGQPAAKHGHGLTGPGQMVVDTRAGIKLGSTVLVGSTPFQVVGTVSDRSLGAGIPMVYVQLADAQKALFGGQP